LAYELGSAGKVADQIRREGLEQPHDPGKVLALGPDHLMPFVDEQLLAEFELREDLRQKLEQLRIWVEKANFSELEARVHDLDMRTEYDTKTIARALDLKGDTVRVLRKRYTDKLRKAAGS
jgi:DNA-binding CsgD family transcriptional regulator